MRSLDYFEAHPVFTHAEFLAAHTAKGRSPSTSNNLLAKHLAAKRLLRVRRGLYATVPRSTDPAHAAIDPYLIASHLSEDAVVAYHAALQFFGKTYSVWQRFHYLSGRRAKTLSFRKMELVPVLRQAAAGSGAAIEEGILETDLQITFQVDNQGRTTGLVVHFAGIDTLAPRLDSGPRENRLSHAFLVAHQCFHFD